MIDPEVHGLLALMLLHHARRDGRTGPDGRIVPLADQDRSRWDDGLIAEELLRFADTPVVRLNRAVAVGAADGARAGLAALARIDEHVPRRDAVAAYLHEQNGDLELAARLYAVAARNAPNLAEREHQTRQAARLNQLLRRRR